MRFIDVAGPAGWPRLVFEQQLLKYINWTGWSIVAIVIVTAAVYRLH